MMSIRRISILFLVASIVTIAGCATNEKPRIQAVEESVRIRTNQVQTDSTDGKNDQSQGASKQSGDQKNDSQNVRYGTGRVINERTASSPPPSLGSVGEATFNFEGEPLQVVIKTILGDLLKQNYVIAPGVQGTVTLNTPRPVNASQALSLLEMVLGWNNARMVWTDGRYNIVPSDKAVQGNLSPRIGAAANARGFETRAVPLKYISATEMEKLIKPYAREGSVVQVDVARNLIVLAGTRSELQNYLRTVEIFDVDWLAGMSVGVYNLESAQASKVVTDLEKVFGESSKTPLAGMFRFMPLEGQNAVMVITPQPKYLKDVQAWIDRMDAGGEGARLYVYNVKNIKATDLADQLTIVFGGTPSNRNNNQPPSIMPGLDPVEISTVDRPAPAIVNNTAPSSTASSMRPGGSGAAEIGISAVEENNSLLIRANPSQWESIRRAIDRLDQMPLQVHIEAQVVEVKLADAMRYGVSWFFGNQIDPPNPILDDWRNTGGSIVPVEGSGVEGQFVFRGPGAEAIISTLDNYSDVRILSAPSVLVLNNQEADFNSGTQIPVASTIINDGGGGGSDRDFSQVQFRQTGVSLKVKPRVSDNGMVFMEITQDVSSPSARGPTIGGNVSVDNNKLKTMAAIQSGETVMLAGLIKTEGGKDSTGLPGLSRIPIIGALFGQQGRDVNRQEVVVLVTPRIVRDPTEARRLTDEYGERFRALDPIRKDQEKANKK
jgi:general secretion pathway protein D